MDALVSHGQRAVDLLSVWSFSVPSLLQYEPLTIALYYNTHSLVVMEPWSAIMICILAGCTYLLLSKLLVMLRLYDAVDAIPVHLGGGILGMIGVGLFASPRRLEEIYGHNEHPGFLY